MSDENKTTNENNTSGESLSGEWKTVGKGLGKTFSGLGKTLIKTAKVGMEKADDWAEDREGVDRSKEVEDMKAGWKNFGGDFVDSAQGVGKTTVKSVKAGAQAVGGDDNTGNPEGENAASENGKSEE